MSLPGLLLRLLLILLSLAAILVVLAVALGRGLRHSWIRDRVRRLNRERWNPIALRSAGKHSSGFAALTHLGRRSGRAYTTPVRAIPFGDGFVIPLPYGADTDWCRNVRAAGSCSLRWRERDYLLGHPDVLPFTQAAHVFPLAERVSDAATGITQCLALHPRRELSE
jgi:deazaflavin-dependent oxidoreductase (nitroreductase family)